MHKYCILSIQQCETLLYIDKFRIFILGFAIYPVAYGLSFRLEGDRKPSQDIWTLLLYFPFTLPIVKWIPNIKQQPIVGGQYFNVPKPTGSG